MTSSFPRGRARKDPARVKETNEATSKIKDALTMQHFPSDYNGRKYTYYTKYVYYLNEEKQSIFQGGRSNYTSAYTIRKATKKLSSFFSGPATKALSPPPLELSGNIVLCDFFRASKKVIFLSGLASTLK